MKKLIQIAQENKAITRPADNSSISELQDRLKFSLSSEYREFLSSFGVIIYGGSETYGLGVPNDYYLNVFDAYKKLSSLDGYPTNSIPLLSVGDGHQYYLYDNDRRQVLLWASTPNCCIQRELDEGLESFLINFIFQK